MIRPWKVSHIKKRKILFDSIVIFVLLGSAVPLFLLMVFGYESPESFNYSILWAPFVLIFIYLIFVFFGVIFSIPAALINYGIISGLVKCGYYFKILKSNLVVIFVGLLNGAMIASILLLLSYSVSRNYLLDASVIIFLYAPCIISAIAFLLFQRKNFSDLGTLDK